MIVQYGSVNLDALRVPGVVVQVVQPNAGAINGQPSDILGQVGVASWGPVNSPTTFGSTQEGAALFGQPVSRKYDLMTHVSTAALQGANNFKGVRVTDGTDLAAFVAVLTNCLSVTSKYTGSGGNGISVSLSPGSQASSYRAVVSMPGVTPERFDNIGLGLTGNAAWVAIAAAINSGAGTLRGPSQIVVATAGVGTTAVVTATYALAGGTDGATGVTGTTLVGNDGVMPRTGMYALRGSQAAVGMLCDCDSASTWPAQVAYGLSEGTYMVGTGPSGDNIANAIATLNGAGIDSYAFKYLHGDWVYWLDPVNGTRVVSPQGFVAGFLANATPSQPALNQQLQGIIATQTTADNQSYSTADLAQLAENGIDCITNPSAGGAYFSCFLGHNTSSNAVIQSDSYTRMTNFEASSLNAGLGPFVGRLNNPSEQSDVVGAVSAFLQGQWDSGLIGNSASPNQCPFSVTLPPAQNTQQQEALGYQFLRVELVYWSIVEKLVCSLVGGSSVVITRQSVSLA